MNTVEKIYPIKGEPYFDSPLKTKAEIFKELRHLFSRRDQQQKLIKYYENHPDYFLNEKIINNLLSSADNELQLTSEIGFYLMRLIDIFVEEMRDLICYDGQEGGNVSDEALKSIALGFVTLLEQEMRGGKTLPEERTFRF